MKTATILGIIGTASSLVMATLRKLAPATINTLDAVPCFWLIWPLALSGCIGAFYFLLYQTQSDTRLKRAGLAGIGSVVAGVLSYDGIWAFVHTACGWTGPNTTIMFVPGFIATCGAGAFFAILCSQGGWARLEFGMKIAVVIGGTSVVFNLLHLFFEVAGGPHVWTGHWGMTVSQLVAYLGVVSPAAACGTLFEHLGVLSLIATCGTLCFFIMLYRRQSQIRGSDLSRIL
jgi:hypothetical protein